MYARSKKDLEEGEKNEKSAVTRTGCASGQEEGICQEDVIVIRLRESNPVLAKMRAAELWMNKKLKIEPMGIERLPDEQRRQPSVLNVSSTSSK